MPLEQENAVISDFLKSIGPWRNHVVIGGGYALIVYKLYLADQRLKNPPVGTRDIDSLIPRKVPKASDKSIAEHLRQAGFAHVFKNMDAPPIEAYVKEIDGLEVEIEFLTDNVTKKDKNANIVVAGVIAQPLSYLDMSLQTTKELMLRTFLPMLSDLLLRISWDRFLQIAGAIRCESPGIAFCK